MKTRLTANLSLPKYGKYRQQIPGWPCLVYLLLFCDSAKSKFHPKISILFLLQAKYGKYGQHLPDWPRNMMMEDPSLVYPYSSSLPRPTPFLGLSKNMMTDQSKYLKSMQALKTMDEEIMKETPTP